MNKCWNKSEKEAGYELECVKKFFVEKGLSAQQIFESGKLPGRTVRSIEAKLRSYPPDKNFYAPEVKAGDIAQLDEILRMYLMLFDSLPIKQRTHTKLKTLTPNSL